MDHYCKKKQLIFAGNNLNKQAMPDQGFAACFILSSGFIVHKFEPKK